MKSGWAAIARAIAMRWRWPPENSCGNLRASAGWRPTSRAVRRPGRVRLSGPAPASPAERADRLGDDVADPPARIERRVRVLEDHLHAPPHRAPRRPIAGRGEIDAFDQHLPRGSARAVRPPCAPASTCPTRIRRPARASRRGESVKSTPSTAFSRRRGSRSIRRESQGGETSKTRRRPRTATMGAAALKFARPPATAARS